MKNTLPAFVYFNSMHHFLKFFLFLTIPCPLSAQISLLNHSLTEPERHILYIAIENRIEISGLQHEGNVKLTCDNEKVQIKATDNHDIFLIRPSSPELEILRVSVNGIEVLADTFEVRRIEDPVVRLGKVEEHKVTVEEIFADPALYVVMPGSFLKSHQVVNTFEFSTWTDSQEVFIPPLNPDTIFIDTQMTISPLTFHDTVIIATVRGDSFLINYGNALTDWQLRYIGGLKPGDMIRFSSIRTRGSGFTPRIFSLTYTIK